MSDLRTLLATIYEKHGALSTEILVTEATDENHPLHNRFEWDDAVAGHQYRLIQGTEIIRSVKVEYVAAEPDEDTKVRQWHAVRRDRTYEPIDEVMQDDIARELLLRQAEREWHALHRRWAHLAEFVKAVRADVA